MTGKMAKRNPALALKKNCSARVWDGATLALENVTTWYWTGETDISSVAVGDVDADGSAEIVTGGGHSDGTRAVAQLTVWTN
jgi:hypothetical protein